MELEYRQVALYILIFFCLFWITGLFVGAIALVGVASGAIDEVDPEEIEFEDELLPFFEEPYVLTNWCFFENHFFEIKMEEEVELDTIFKKTFDNKFFYKNNNKWEKFLYLSKEEEKYKKNNIIFIEYLSINEK